MATDVRNVSTSCPRTRIAVAGFGHCGAAHVRALEALGTTDVTVVDSDPAGRAEAGRLHPRVSVCSDLEQALARVDAVVVATGRASRAAVAARALRAGRHVLVEPPFATSVAEAVSLLDEARRRGLVLAIGHSFVHDPAVSKFRGIVESGALGRILHLQSAVPGSGPHRSDCDEIWDLAARDVAVLLHLLGEIPQRVDAWTHSDVGPDRADVTFLRLGFERARTNALVRVSWLDALTARRANLVGDLGRAVCDDPSEGDRVRIYRVDGNSADPRAGREVCSMPIVAGPDPVLVQDGRFVEAVLAGTMADSQVELGLDVVRVLVAAEEAHRTASSVLVHSDGTRQALALVGVAS